MDSGIWVSPSLLFQKASELLSTAPSSLSASVLPVQDGVTRCMLWTLIACVLVTFLWRKWFSLARDPASKLPLPPGSMGYPLVGESLAFLINGGKYYVTKREKYGNVYKTHMLGNPTVRVIGNENIRNIFMGEHVKVESSWPKSTSALMGPGSLLNSSPDSHKIRRKLLLQAMSPTVLAGHIDHIQKMIHDHLKSWCDQGEQLGYVLCKEMSMALATSVLIGFRLDSSELQTTIENFRIFVNNLFALPWQIPGLGLWKGLRARDKILGQIKKRLKTETSQWCLVDELKRLDETAASLSDDELCDSILELWFAGNDTTTSTTTSVLLALGREPNVVGQIEEELQRHDLGDPGSEITLQKLNQLTYIDHVIKEVLRVYPPVGGGFRKAKTTLEIGGYQIPKGWTIIYSIRDTHQTSELFKQREEFQPQRWDEIDEKTRELGNKFHFLPFGAGARACAGKKFAMIFLKIFIVELVRTCKWELKNKDPLIRYFPITQPADKLPITFALKNRKD